MSVPTFDEDLDAVMRLGYGRRLLRRMVERQWINAPFMSDPLALSYNLGLTQHARDLNDQMRRVNPEAWLIMQREAMQEADAEDKEVPRGND